MKAIPLQIVRNNKWHPSKAPNSSIYLTEST